jgi:hypothetical protein
MPQFEQEPRRNELVHFNCPRAVKHCHTFKVLIHVDAVEDLLFYHFPRENLIADGKDPWRDFPWQLGKEDGDLDEYELHPPNRGCERDIQ